MDTEQKYIELKRKSDSLRDSIAISKAEIEKTNKAIKEAVDVATKLYGTATPELLESYIGNLEMQLSQKLEEIEKRLEQAGV